MSEKRNTYEENVIQNALDEIRQDCHRNPARRAKLFRRLAADIAQTDADSPSCATVQACLDVYLATALEGQDASPTRFPLLWSHLQSCSDCQVHADLLQAALAPLAREDAPGPIASPRLSFLPGRFDSPWVTLPWPRMATLRRGVRVLLNPSFLRDRLHPQPLPLRGLERPSRGDRSRLLLADLVQAEDEDWNVEVRAVVPPDDTEQWVIEANVSCDGGFPPDLQATLVWAGEAYTQAVGDGGTVRFPPVPIAALSEPAATFALTITAAS